MSVLTNTSGTPQRVYALIRLISALGGSPGRATVEGMMTARSDDEGDAPTKRSDFPQTLGAARDLNLITEVDGSVQLVEAECPRSYLEFADVVHRRLVSSGAGDGNAVVLDAFAFIAHRTDAERGPHWFVDMDRNGVADMLRVFIDSKREQGGTGTFNPTQLSHWQKWTDLVGLTVQMDRDRPFPDVTARLTREIEADERLSSGEEIPALTFVGHVLDRMPYLPGGSRSLALLGPPVTDKVPDLLSAALRDLQADGVIQLRTIGDAGNAMTLSQDAVSPSMAFNSVRLASIGRPA